MWEPSTARGSPRPSSYIEVGQPAPPAGSRRAHPDAATLFRPRCFSGSTRPTPWSGRRSACAQRAHLPHACRGHQEGQRHRYGLACSVWTTRRPSCSRSARPTPVWSGPTAPTSSTPPAPSGACGTAARTGGRPGRALALPRHRSGEDRLMRLTADKTLKMYVGGKFIRSSPGRSCPPPPRRPSERAARQPQGHLRHHRHDGPPSQAGRLDGLQPRPDPLPPRRDPRLRAEGLPCSAEEVLRPPTGPCTLPAGPTRSVPCRGQPRRGCLHQLPRIAPMGIVVGSTRGMVSWASWRRSARPGHGQRRRGGGVVEQVPQWPWPRPSRSPMCPAAWSTS